MPDPTGTDPGTQSQDPAKPNPGTGGNPIINPELYLTKEEFGRSAAMIRGLDGTLKTLQGSMLTLDTLAQVGLLEAEEVDGKKTYKPKGAAPATKPRAEDDPIVQRVKTLEAQLDKARKENEAKDLAVSEAARNTAIMSALREAGAVNPERDFVHLRERVLKNDAGYFAKGVDDAGYEIEVRLPDLAVLFLKQNPELKKAANQGGAGSPGSGGAGGAKGAPGLRPGQTLIPRTQWANPDATWFMQNKAKFDSGEYVRGQ